MTRRPRSTDGSSTRWPSASARPVSTTGPRSSPATTRGSACRQHRYGYTSEVITNGVNLHGATIKIDVESGTTEAHEYGRGRGGAEPIFVPKADGTAEDAGWILSVVYDATTDASELCILDAEDITGPEVARIHLPQRVPFGFHGNWAPDTSVAPRLTLD